MTLRITGTIPVFRRSKAGAIDTKGHDSSAMTVGFRSWLTFWGVVLSVIAGAPGFAENPPETSFESVQAALIKDGFDPGFVGEIYSHPRVGYDYRSVSLFFIHREATLNYDQFTTEASLLKAREYMKANAETLSAAESVFGVDPRVITAILLVETRLGTVTGGRSVLNILSTMAALRDPETRENLWNSIPEDRRMSRNEFEKKANSRAAWAYQELTAFLEYARHQRTAAVEIDGSYAGALGIAQFMPTSIQAYARDGDADNRIDLYTHEDAIFSVANYLKNSGWKPGIGREKAEKVIFQYNRSRYYVDTIWKIRESL